MSKNILITGSTDGIGLETAKTLAAMGHQVLLHGRNPEKLAQAVKAVSEASNGGSIESYLADFSDLADAEAMAKAVSEKHDHLDVVINNAGILKTSTPITPDGLDIRFVVNTLAPYLLTQKLMPLLSRGSRIINLSSAAQSPVNPKALSGEVKLDEDLSAYAQSKLAITMWSRHMADSLKESGIVVVSINPGSLLATKMVKEGFGMDGKDINIGVDILVRAALSEEFETATGLYYDNDSGKFAPPHPDALNDGKCAQIVALIEQVLGEKAA
jgi:NAD(P)-dependent dehydrogenase (short-subunit alcohol dehydrogenase family)